MLLISKQYLLNLAKAYEKFDKNKLFEFFCLWPNFNEFVIKIFDCLQQSSFYSQDSLSKT